MRTERAQQLRAEHVSGGTCSKDQKMDVEASQQGQQGMLLAGIDKLWGVCVPPGSQLSASMRSRSLEAVQ